MAHQALNRIELLERELQLDVLRSALVETREGQGRVVLVSGEAGIGKTSLVESFTTGYCRPNEVLYGACDALFTPRPLGPFLDIARQAYPDLFALLNSGSGWLPVASAFLERLQKSPSTTVVAIEDVHWADEATLDLLKYLGRRIHQAHALLILSYRDDEIGANHPLRFLLGDLPARSTTRLVLPPLSEPAVASLAQRLGKPPSGIYSATGGNPFFVTEVLASDESDVPDTVRDAVLGRASRLSAPARRVLDLASVVPGAIEQWLIRAVLHPDVRATGECIEHGLLRTGDVNGEGTGLAFRHELARRAVESSLSPAEAGELHAQVLRALSRSGGNPPLARLVHHAAHAGDQASVLKFAPSAARQASASGAHREAAAHYATALGYPDALKDEDRAELLEGLSFERYLTGEIDEAIEAREEATEIRRRVGQQEKAGDDTRWLSRLYWWRVDRENAERFADEAIALLEPLGTSEALAMAYSNRSQLYMLADDSERARQWGILAYEMAERLGATEILVHALLNLGTAELKSGGMGNRATMERGLALALQHEMHDHAGRGYANLLSLAVQTLNYELAEHYLNEGIAYTTSHDLDSYGVYYHGWRARLRFEQGRWKEAEEDAATSLAGRGGGSVMRIPALIVMGHLKVRRGDPGGWVLLDEARKLSMPTGELQRIGPLSAARAEAAWWDGDAAGCIEEARIGYELALGTTDTWMLGALAYWMWRAGGLPQPPDTIPAPYRQMSSGQWREAAAEWERIGCPYEQALALSEGDEAAKLQALEIFERLGARPAADDLKRTLRAAGVKRIPRGPRPTTRSHPFGLTGREREILALIEKDLSNAQIAHHMSISAKTVDHHVSSILAKLNAHKRSEAAAIARRLEDTP